MQPSTNVFIYAFVVALVGSKTFVLRGFAVLLDPMLVLSVAALAVPFEGRLPEPYFDLSTRRCSTNQTQSTIHTQKGPCKKSTLGVNNIWEKTHTKKTQTKKNKRWETKTVKKKREGEKKR